MDNNINEIAVQFAKRVSEQYKTKAFFLYGSHSKGTAKNYSDIDIAVVVEPMETDSFFNMFGKLYSIASDFEANIEPNLLEDDGNYDKFSFLAEVMETGQRINLFK